MNLGERIQHAWNAFLNRSPTEDEIIREQPSVSSYYQERPRLRMLSGDRSIVTAIFNRIALDCAAIDVRHVRKDDLNRYLEDIDSSLNECFTVSANLDQTPRSFFQDIVQSMLDEGVVAIVPVETSANPSRTGSYDIFDMRVGKIVAWYPTAVRVRLYNEKSGLREEITVLKKSVAIIQNPLYEVINEPNSTMQRLIRKLALLDYTDENNSTNKLDIIIQLPYTIKTSARQKQAEERRQSIEKQLKESKYGIAYTDATEKIVQLNRPIDNNLMSQIEYLTSMLYSQLGMTKEILDGTASEQVMLNYYARTIEPIMAAIVDEMRRKFLTKTARTQKQDIMYFRNPFRLAPISAITDFGDKFTRNEIMSSNEIRQILGLKPDPNPKSDELRNKSLYPEEAPAGYGQGIQNEYSGAPYPEEYDTSQYEEE